MTASEAKRLAMLDASLDLYQEPTSGRLALPPAVQSGYARATGTPPLRQYSSTMPHDALYAGVLNGEICISAWLRLEDMRDAAGARGTPVTLMEAIQAGLPRRQILRGIELFDPDTPERLRLYAADVADLLTDAAPEDMRPTLGAAVQVARGYAVGGSPAGSLERIRERVEGLTVSMRDVNLQSVVLVHTHLLRPDAAEAAQACNLYGNRTARALAFDFLREHNGPALQKMTYDIDRALTQLLQRYEAGQP